MTRKIYLWGQSLDHIWTLQNRQEGQGQLSAEAIRGGGQYEPLFSQRNQP